MRSNEIELDQFLESYLTRWQSEIIEPLLEWNRSLLEAKLTQPQIDALFSDIEQQMSSEKTSAGKALNVAGKVAKTAYGALPPNLANKLHDLIKDTKPVKAFDQAFEDKKAEILAKNPKLEKIVNVLGDKARKHPVVGAAVIGILTTAAALMTGGIGGFAVAAVLKTGNDLLKGESLSKSLLKGVGAGALGALAAMPLRMLGDWLSTFEISSETVPGYTGLTNVSIVHKTNGIMDLSIKTYMPTEVYHKVTKLTEIASQAIADDNYGRAAEIYKSLEKIFDDPNYISSMDEIAANNQALVDKAVEGAKKTANVFNVLASTVQGGTTGAASKKLDEADLKLIAGSIAKWAKDKAAATGKEISQTITVKKLVSAWQKAGSPTDSDAIHSILKSAGVPDTVLQQAFVSNKVPVPKAPAKTRSQRAKPVKVNTGDAALDKQINDIIATKGKDAAIQYLTTMKTNMLKQAPAQAKHGEIRKASDGQEYKLDVGKTGDRIWFNVKTNNEASAAIDKELEQGVPARKKRVRRRPKPSTKAAPTAGNP